MLEGLGAEVSDVLSEDDLDAVDALVIPGGESTTIEAPLASISETTSCRASSSALQYGHQTPR